MEEEITDDQAGEGYEEETPIPKIVPDDYLAEVLTKSAATIENLKADGQFLLAEEIDKLGIIARNLKQQVLDEQSQIELMKSEVEDAQGRVAESIRVSANDQDVMTSMRNEIAEAWKQRDAAQSREQVAQENMYILREKLDVFQKEKDKYAGGDSAQGDGLGKSKSKENIFHERDKLKSEVNKNEKKIEALQRQIGVLEQQLQEKDNKINKFYEIMDESSTETTKDKRLIASLQSSMETALAEKDKLQADNDILKTERDAKQKTIAQQNMQIMRVRTQYENATMKLNAATMKTEKLTLENEQAMMQLELSRNELNTKTNILKLKEEECGKYRSENSKILKMRDACLKRLLALETTKSLLDLEVVKMKNVIVTFEKERDASTKAFEKAKKQMETLKRERDLVRKDLLRANKLITEHLDHVMLLEKHKKQLESEIKEHILVQQRLKQTVAKTEKERDKISEENKLLQDKVSDLQEDIFNKANYISELKENLGETKTKLFQVQQQFEIVRTERNLYERDLQACTEVRDDLRERLRISNHQVDQLKEVISAKEAELSKAEKNIEQLERDKQSLKKDLQNTVINLQHAKTEIQELKMEAALLRKIISENETEIKKLLNNLRNVNNEKDYISQQLTMRNAEIQTMKDKMALLQISLDRGESQYNQRLEDIRLLKVEVANLRSQRNLLTRGLSNTADMRQEVLQLNRVLTMERVKNKALEDEMSTPMNIHRWRKLSGVDPDKNSLILKCQALQKRIISQTSHGEKREFAIQEIQKLYITLSDSYTKLESTNDPELVNKKQRVLTAQTKKMKALMAELNCRELDVQAKDCALVDLKKNLLLTKKELIKEKRDKQRILDFENNLQKDEERAHQMQMAQGPGYRTMGGGFKMPM